MRVNIKHLVKAGIIKNGDKIYWHRKVKNIFHHAIIFNNMIQTQDGINHKSPSGAAKHLNNNKPVDGWFCWRLSSSNENLDTLRTQLIILRK